MVGDMVIGKVTTGRVVVTASVDVVINGVVEVVITVVVAIFVALVVIVVDVGEGREERFGTLVASSQVGARLLLYTEKVIQSGCKV